MSFPKTDWATGDVWDAPEVNDLEQRTADYIATQPAAALTPTWEPLQDPGVGGRVVKVHISRYDSNRIFVSGDMLGVMVSYDGGATFEGGYGLPSYEMGSFTEHPRDPMTVWCGSMSGPVKSVDGGFTWGMKRSGMPALSTTKFSAPVEKILFDPADVDHLLAFGGSWRIWKYYSGGGVSSGGYGSVWESTNGGDTWTLKSTVAANENIMWATAASDWSSMWVATQHYGAWVSTNQGDTWTQKITGLPSFTGAETNWGTSSILIDPVDVTNQTLFVSLSSSTVLVGGLYQPGGVYKTTNGGTTWALAGSGQPQQTSNVSQQSATSLDGVHQTADGTLWFSDQNTTHNNDFYKSTNHGATWTHVVPSIPRYFPGPLNVHAFASDPNNASVIWGGTNDGLVFTTDAGVTWQDGGDLIVGGSKRGRGYSGVLAYRITFSKFRKGFLIVNGADSAQAMLTKDGGQSWSNPIWAWDYYDGGYGSDIGGPLGNVIYVLLGNAPGGTFNGVAVSQDSGATWSFKVGSGLPNRHTGGSNHINGVAIGSADGSVAFVAWGGTLYKTTTFGTSWSTVGSSTQNVAVTGDFATVYAPTSTGVYAGPTSLTVAGQFVLATGSPKLSRIVPDAQNNLWGTGYPSRFGGGYSAGVWYSAAGSGVWAQKYNGTFASYCVDVAVDPYDIAHVIVATDQNPFLDVCKAGGVLETRDGGATWSQQSQGLRMIRVGSVAFDPHDEGRVVCGTDGAGCFTTKLYGANTPMPKGVHAAVSGVADVPSLELRLRKLQNSLDTINAAARTIVQVPYAATITPALSAGDRIYNVATLTGAVQFNAPSGTPVDGQLIEFLLIQDGSGHAVTWGTGYVFGTDVTAGLDPVTAGATWRRLFQYNSAAASWEALAIARGF